MNSTTSCCEGGSFWSMEVFGRHFCLFADGSSVHTRLLSWLLNATIPSPDPFPDVLKKRNTSLWYFKIVSNFQFFSQTVFRSIKTAWWKPSGVPPAPSLSSCLRPSTAHFTSSSNSFSCVTFFPPLSCFFSPSFISLHLSLSIAHLISPTRHLSTSLSPRLHCDFFFNHSASRPWNFQRDDSSEESWCVSNSELQINELRSALRGSGGVSIIQMVPTKTSVICYVWNTTE